jgi:DNA repair protein RadC
MIRNPNFVPRESARDAAAVYAWALKKKMNKLLREEVWVLSLDSHTNIIKSKMITRGTGNKIFVQISDILRCALELGGIHFIMVHNHPNQYSLPSAEDLALTKRLIEASKLIELPLLDHVVVAENGYVSIRSDYDLWA